MYKVIKKFHDLQDATKTKNGMIYHEYNVGDEFPRKGREVSEERLEELAGKENKQGVPLIELVKEKAAAEKTVKKSSSAKTLSRKASASATTK